jgi:competence CoiA-like predicted nuclease
MKNTSLLQLFAIDKQNQIRSIDEVTRGLSCECTCPSCGEAVIARQGEVREWHFAHASTLECSTGAETESPLVY